MTRRRWMHIIAILLAATALRIFYANLVWTPAAKSPDASMSVMYVRSAYLLAAGLGYSQTIPGSPAYKSIEGVGGLKETARDGKRITLETGGLVPADGLYPETLHPPGWSILGAIFHRATGLPVWLVMQILGILFDLAACGILYGLTLNVLKKHKIAATATLLYALFPPFAYASVRLQPIGFVCFFVLLETAIVLSAARRKGRLKFTLYALCGVLLGVSAYFRPDYLLLGPFLMAGVWWNERRYWQPLVLAVGMTIISVAVLSPWAYRNHEQLGRWVFTSTSAGATLITGLGGYPNPWGFGPSDIDRAKEASAQGISTPWSSEADLYFRKTFVEAIKSHPGAYIGILLRKSWMPLAPPHDWGLTSTTRKRPFYEIRREGKVFDNLKYVIHTYWSRALSSAIMLLGNLGLLLIVFKEPARRKDMVFLILVILYAAFSHVFTVMFPIYILPAAFVPLIGLAYILNRGWQAED